MSDTAAVVRRSFIVACGLGRMDGVRNYKGDVNRVFADEATGLTQAAAHGQYGAVEELVTKKGAKVDMPDGKGLLPLTEAVRHGHPEVTQFLLDQGAAADKADVWGPALLFAYRSAALARLVLRAGGSPNHPAHPPLYVDVEDEVLEAWCREGWARGAEADLTRPLWGEQPWLDSRTSPAPRLCV